MKQLVQVLAVMQFLLINLCKVNIKSTKKKTSMNVGNWSKMISGQRTIYFIPPILCNITRENVVFFLAFYCCGYQNSLTFKLTPPHTKINDFWEIEHQSHHSNRN